MNRELEFEQVKHIIRDNFDDADSGLFNTRNIAGDTMITIFDGEFFQVDICYSWCYFEVFGTSDKEFEELSNLYRRLVENRRGKRGDVK